MEYSTSFDLQLMPLEVIEIIAHYLTIKDLGSCCATSRTLRELFGYDGIWKPRCAKALADYLKNTPCKVEPGFISPENDESTLSPIQKWRMAFMIENHLWNNWRQGKYQEEVLQSPTATVHNKISFYDIFQSNDCVISRFSDRIELLDVKGYLPQLATEPIILNILLNSRDSIHENFDVKVSENSVLIIYISLILVYKVDLFQKKCLLHNVFFFNRSIKEPLCGSYESQLKNIDSREMYFIEGDYFVGIDKESTMHIWNYESGLKLKEEHCPFRIIDAKSSGAMILVLAVKYLRHDTVTFIAFSLTTLDYIPFKETLPSTVEYRLLNHFVGIWNNENLFVYNCKTSELLLKGGPIESAPQAIHGCFIFIQDHQLKTFNPVDKIMAVLPLNNVDDFEVLGGRFVQVHRPYPNRSLWEVDRSMKTRKTLMRLNFDTCGFFLNEAATRYIVRYARGHILNFW